MVTIFYCYLTIKSTFLIFSYFSDGCAIFSTFYDNCNRSLRQKQYAEGKKLKELEVSIFFKKKVDLILK